MALDIQTVFPVRSFQPYERPPQPMALWTFIPRGLESLTASRALDAKAVNDSALVTIPWVLSPNFGWLFEDLTFSITQDRATDWSDNCNLNFQNYSRLGEVGLNANYRSRWLTSAQDGQTRTLTRKDQSSPWPHTPMMTPDGFSGVSLNFTAFNNQAAVAAAGTLNFSCSFWQFDLEQMRKFPINSPLPVSAR